MAQSTRFGYAKQTLKINYIKIFGRQSTTHCGHSDMYLGFPKPDIRGELQIGNNMLYK
jgi:hypothetical protein